MDARLSKETIAALLELRRVEKMSIDEIAVRIGCSRSTVSYQFGKAGLAPGKGQVLPTRRRQTYRREGRQEVRAFTLEEDVQLVEMAEQGMRTSDIARALGRKPNTVLQRRWALERHLATGTRLADEIQAARRQRAAAE